MIPHSRPTLDGFDLSVAGELLTSGRLARGQVSERLESLFCARFLDSEDRGPWRARAVSSGTTALHVGLWALSNLRSALSGTCPGEVVTTALGCNALIHAILAVGARPVLVDTLPDGNPDAEKAAERVTSETLAVLAPHLYGNPVDLSPLLSLDAPIFEDCAQCFGTEGPNGRVGARGALMMTSFYATKLICTGQGGLVATDDSELIKEIRDLCEYDHREDAKARWNMNLSDWCAQLALPQLQSHAENLQQRRQIAGRYTEAFADLREKLEVPEPCPGHVWYRYVLLTPEASEPWIEDLVSQGIETKRPVYAPLQRTFGLSGRFPVAEDHWRRSLSLPIYPTLTEGEQEQVIEAVKRAAGRLL